MCVFIILLWVAILCMRARACVRACVRGCVIVLTYAACSHVYIDYPFGSWSSWKPDCYSSLNVSGVTPVNQSRTRSRECNISSDCTPCPLDVETRTGL